MTETNLKPCPFCGGEAKCIEFYGLYHVICCNCHIAGKDCPTRESAVSAWNARPIENELESENARLREALEKYAAPEHHFSVVDGKVWEVFDNSYGVDEQEFGTWAHNALNGMDK